MKKILCVLAVLVITGVSFAAEDQNRASQPKERCPVCGMFVGMFADWNATIAFRDGARATFDGPKDMFKYYLDMKKYNPSKTTKDVSAVLVKDYYSKSPFDALKAYYVVWGDEYGPMGHEPVPFEKEADAKKYLQEHKGKTILRFPDVTPKLLWELDNP